MYQIRKVKEYTVLQQSNVIQLDPERFRNLSKPYTGNSEDEFLSYLETIDFYEMYDEFDDDTKEQLDQIHDNCDWQEFYCSTQDSEKTWLEIGEKDDYYVRSGGFNCFHSTLYY